MGRRSPVTGRPPAHAGEHVGGGSLPRLAGAPPAGAGGGESRGAAAKGPINPSPAPRTPALAATPPAEPAGVGRGVAGRASVPGDLTRERLSLSGRTMVQDGRGEAGRDQLRQIGRAHV